MKDNEITLVEVKPRSLKCPFRTITTAYNSKNPETGNPEAHQMAGFPDCYYDECPFYSKGVCQRAEVELGKSLAYKRK